MRWLIRVRSLVVGVVGAVAALAGPSVRAANTGIDSLGLPRSSAAETQALGGLLLQGVAGGNVECSMLWEFNPSNPFGNATALTQAILPSIPSNRQLRWNIYLKFDHTYVNNQNGDPFWTAWNASAPTAAQMQIRNDYMARVQVCTMWVKGMRAWATARGLQSRLGITVIPVLEDTCPVAKRHAWDVLINAIASNQAAAGIGQTPFRRSCLIGGSDNVFRPGNLPLELHGTWAQARARGVFRPGDYWSPDGSEYASIAAYVADQRQALGLGINCLYWTGAYNGSPRTSPPHQRTVNPFTGPTGATERSKALQALNGR